MLSTETLASPNIPAQPVAPWWHTLLVLAPITIGSIASAYQRGLPNANLPGMTHRLSSYLTVLAEEWLGVFLVWLALRRRGLALDDLVMGRWRSLSAFLRDLGFAIGFMIIVVPLAGVLAYLLGANNNPAIANITPRTVSELVVFLVLTASAGFAEELVFRGYLAQQFGAWTRRASLGIVLQGVAFGLAHAFYGKAMIAIMVQGGFWDCLLMGARAYVPECSHTGYRTASAAWSHSSRE